MKADRRNKSRFGRGLAIYTLLLMGLILAGLVFFYFYMAAYEYSRPENALRRYLDGEERQLLRQQSYALIDSVNTRVQSEEELRSILDGLIEEVSKAKIPSESTESRQVYALRSDGHTIGKLTLSKSEKKRMGFSPWEIDQTAVDLSFLLKQEQVTVPRDYRVVCGEAQLGSEDIVENAVHYDLLEEFYDNYELPTMVTYSSGNYIGDLSLRVYDAAGRELSAEELTQEHFTDNCSAKEKEDINAFVQEYIPRYVTYLSGANGAHYLNLYDVLAWTVENSDLYSRLYQALGGQGWASSQGDYLQSYTVNQVMRLKPGVYVCDVTFLVQTYGQNGAKTITTNNTKLLVQETDKGLRAFAQASY